MTIRKFHRFGLVILMACIAGCTQAVDTPVLPSTATPTLSTELSSSASTISPEPSETPTAIPTLTAALARTRLLDLLTNNGSCRLPCLWGITPGSSTYQDAQAVLAPLSSISDVTKLYPSPGAIDPVYTEGDLKTLTDLRFLYANDGIISRIAFHLREGKTTVASNGETGLQYIFDSKTFGQRARAYMLPQILTQQGIPAAVLIQTSGAQVKGDGGFEILLFYPSQGLFVHYTTQMQLNGTEVRGCPADSQVELQLFPAGHPESFSEFLAPTEWASLWPVPETENPFWKPVEKATSMTLEQFYETFRQPTDKCIETPAKLWPTP